MPRATVASDVHPAFERIVRALRLDGSADTDTPAMGKRPFGASALKVGGKIFAMPSKGTVVLKLPAARVDALIEAGAGDRYDPGHGRIMKEWIALSGDDRGWLTLAREARKFVAG